MVGLERLYWFAVNEKYSWKGKQCYHDWPGGLYLRYFQHPLWRKYFNCCDCSGHYCRKSDKYWWCSVRWRKKQKTGSENTAIKLLLQKVWCLAHGCSMLEIRRCNQFYSGLPDRRFFHLNHECNAWSGIIRDACVQPGCWRIIVCRYDICDPGNLVLLARIIAPFINAGAINKMPCAGSLLILMIGTNLMGIEKSKLQITRPPSCLLLFCTTLLHTSRDGTFLKMHQLRDAWISLAF